MDDQFTEDCHTLILDDPNPGCADHSVSEREAIEEKYVIGTASAKGDLLIFSRPYGRDLTVADVRG